MQQSELSLNNITCKRGHKTLFADFSLDIHSGDLIQITGANGAGKTSLIRMIAGLLPMTSGNITWQGSNIHGDDPKSYQQLIRMICPQNPMKNALTVSENLEFWASIYQQENNDATKRAMQKIGIDNLSQLPFQHLSSGQQAKVNLARLWLSPSKIWLLDEAFNAFDQESCNKVCEDVLAFQKEGGIIIYTSHFDLPLNKHAKKVKIGA